MSILSSLLSFFILSFAAMHLWKNREEIKHLVVSPSLNYGIKVMDERFSLEDIIDKQSLFYNEGWAFKETIKELHPHLVMNVKYNSHDTTKEGTLICSLTDGEFILETERWSKTHGMGDCIKSSISSEEMKLLSHLATRHTQKDSIDNINKLEIENVQSVIEICKQKRLIVSSNSDTIRLHIPMPKWPSAPITRINNPIIEKSGTFGDQIEQNFTKEEVTKFAEMIFGQEFFIKNTKLVFLPVYLTILEKDDSGTKTSKYSRWNSITGDPFHAEVF